ncbi:MAG: DUF4157 domain-containing protein [Alphaproteobacteria bacterium]|nr:DUF4157 domain-containing protein [Alphaproteobacteria bacterium]
MKPTTKGHTTVHINQDIGRSIAASQGCNGKHFLSSATRQWLGGLIGQIPEHFEIHHDDAAKEAAAKLGVTAFVLHNKVFLGEMPGNLQELVVRHELVHLAQVQIARQTGNIAPSALVEREADTISFSRFAQPVRCGAHPDQVHPIFWVPIILGAMVIGYVCTRSTPANAPGPNDNVLPHVNDLQPYGEAIVLFVVPAGAFSLGGRLGFGLIGSSVFAGAVSAPASRAVNDAFAGQMSPVKFYIFDTASGAVIGFVFGAGVQYIGSPILHKIDNLATYGIFRDDMRILQILLEESPQTVTETMAILGKYNLTGRVSRWYINQRNLIVGYRGQTIPTHNDPGGITSPLVRRYGRTYAEELYELLKRKGITDDEIRTWMARYHDNPLRVENLLSHHPDDLVGLRAGGLSIPTTTLPGVASGFAPGNQGVVYILRLPKDKMILAEGYPLLKLEFEHGVLHNIPEGAVIKVIPAKDIPALTIGKGNVLVPGHSVN